MGVSIVRPALVLFACVLFAAVCQAQWLGSPSPGIPRLADGKPDLNAAVPRTSYGKPDLSGVWRRAADDTHSTTFLASGLGEIPLQPSARELYNRRLAVDGAGRPAERCLPHGLPLDMMFREAPFRIVQTPALTVILLEMFNRFRQVPTDGRSLVPDPQPTWLGYSTGRWEGDEFVVETVGFNDQTWLDNRGLPHSDALRLTERFKRLNVGRMDLTFTIDDAKAYTRPWSVTMKFELLPDTDLLEYMCDNEKWASTRAQPR
jgi:hypothetical protein